MGSLARLRALALHWNNSLELELSQSKNIGVELQPVRILVLGSCSSRRHLYEAHVRVRQVHRCQWQRFQRQGTAWFSQTSESSLTLFLVKSGCDIGTDH